LAAHSCQNFFTVNLIRDFCRISKSIVNAAFMHEVPSLLHFFTPGSEFLFTAGSLPTRLPLWSLKPFGRL